MFPENPDPRYHPENYSRIPARPRTWPWLVFIAACIALPQIIVYVLAR